LLIIMHCAKKCGLFLLVVFFAAAIGAAAALSYAGEWLSAGDRPQQADAILVLSGDYARSFHAADLYRQGFARRIYVSVPARDDQYRLLDEAGIAFPREEEVVRQVLLNRRR
jgi:hypothetical protein